VHIGRAGRVIEDSAIKDNVCLGHTTKVGGEVEGSIIEPYTNKQHHGFLGHAYLGSWVNLGAGTSNSDLKNTYGEVNMEYNGAKVSTGMQFVGCMVGDYAKSAVNTSIFTGKVVGAGSLLYGFVTTNVASFVNYARSFGQVTEVPVEVLVHTQARMFARRNVEQRPCDVQLLHDMHALTRNERQIAGEPLAL
jgi:glucose-1-phosphate thymidylyltransferase